MVLVLIFLSLAFANPPPLTEEARKDSQAERSVIKDSIDDQKESVLNKKTQLQVFKQVTKSENIDSSFPIVNILHVNEMSGRYKIFSLVYMIDKDRVYSYHIDDTPQPLGRETKIFNQPLVPGTHEITVDVVYRGNDTGVFSYINDFKIPVLTKKNFKIDKGQKMTIKVTGYEKGWALTELKERPTIAIDFNSSKPLKELK